MFVEFDIGLILRFGGKFLIVFGLIFLAAVFTPKIAEYIDRRKKEIRQERFPVRSIYELPPERKKKVIVRKKKHKK